MRKERVADQATTAKALTTARGYSGFRLGWCKGEASIESTVITIRDFYM